MMSVFKFKFSFFISVSMNSMKSGWSVGSNNELDVNFKNYYFCYELSNGNLPNFQNYWFLFLIFSDFIFSLCRESLPGTTK